MKEGRSALAHLPSFLLASPISHVIPNEVRNLPISFNYCHPLGTRHPDGIREADEVEWGIMSEESQYYYSDTC